MGIVSDKVCVKQTRQAWVGEAKRREFIWDVWNLELQSVLMLIKKH